MTMFQYILLGLLIVVLGYFVCTCTIVRLFFGAYAIVTILAALIKQK